MRSLIAVRCWTVLGELGVLTCVVVISQVTLESISRAVKLRDAAGLLHPLAELYVYMSTNCLKVLMLINVS
jgi:hypothetical protein